jgi:hypothetical protein
VPRGFAGRRAIHLAPMKRITAEALMALGWLPMTTIRRLAVILLGLLAMLAPASAAERVLSFLSDVMVERNGDLQVTETIVVEAEGDKIRHGILRDFPTTYLSRRGVTIVVGFDVHSVARDGKIEKFTLEKVYTPTH